MLKKDRNRDIMYTISFWLQPLKNNNTEDSRMKSKIDLKSLVGQMTLEEKIGQLIQLSADFFGNASELTGPAQDWGLDEKQLSTIGTCIGGGSAEAIRAIQENHLKHDRNKIPMIFMLDVIHGYRTIYPMGLAMACSFNPELVSSCTAMAAKEAAAGGTHLTFAPMVDLSRDPRWGRVMESCGEDPSKSLSPLKRYALGQARALRLNSK